MRALVPESLAVAGDPLADVRAVERVAFVMKNGEVVKGPGAAPDPTAVSSR